MAFVVSVLESALLTVFNSMKENATSLDFAQGISNAVVSFVGTGSVSTTDAGAVTGGTFAGSGNGNISVTATACLNIIKTACDNMENDGTVYDNNYLAEQIGAGLKQMSDDAVVLTTVSGTLTTPSGATSPLAGSAKGTISCSNATLITALKALFLKMYNKKDDTTFNGNSEFAKELASQINSFYTSGLVSTDGLATLSGSKGTGSVS